MVAPILIPDECDDNGQVLFEDFCDLIRTQRGELGSVGEEPPKIDRYKPQPHPEPPTSTSVRGGQPTPPVRAGVLRAPSVGDDK